MNSNNLAICFGCVLVPKSIPHFALDALFCLSPLTFKLPFLPELAHPPSQNQLSSIELTTTLFLHTNSPTLMGSNAGQNIRDAGWQVQVIDTILQNTYQIFDDD